MNNMKEKTSFILVFGESPVVKVIDFFIDNQEFDYSLTDIAKNAERTMRMNKSRICVCIIIQSYNPAYF